MRLMNGQQGEAIGYPDDSLRVKVEVGPVDLVKPPEQVFRSSVDVVTARVVGEIIAQRRSCKLELEEIDLV